jgi:DNA-binding NarL/FixJ family response regulator
MQKVILVDDHQLVRQCLRRVLAVPSATWQVVAEAANAPELFSLLKDTEADIVVLDLDLPGMDGLEATSYLKVRYPALKVLILSMMDQQEYVSQAMDAGADGYLSKASNQEELLLALQLVATGHKYIMPQLSLKLLGKVPVQQAPSRRPGPGSPAEILSKRELEILRLIAEGFTAEKIADKLFTSRRTVETHRQNILEKTKTRNTPNLVLYALRHHLLD